jgi:O-antigen ligase
MQYNNNMKKWIRILLCFFICLQMFPPILVLDVTSLRHFLIALFDIVSIGLVLYYSFWKKQEILSRSIFTKNPLMPIWLLLIIYMGASISWAINPIEGWAVLNRWILIFLAMIISIGFMLKDNHAMKNLIICTLVIATINVLSCIICYYVFDVHISQRNNLKLNGFYGNKNIFAVAFLFKLPFLYYAVLRFKNFIRYYSLFLIFAVSFCLLILSTRSSFIGLFLQLAVLGFYGVFYKIKSRKLSIIFKHSRLYLLICLVGVAGFVLGDAFIKYNFNNYSKIKTNNYSIEARVSSIAEGNSKGRLLIWENTCEIIKQSPLSGYGVGNHKLAIMKVECAKKHDYVVSDHAHNDFLEMFSELGIFGFLIYVSTYLVFGIMALRQMFLYPHLQHRLLAIVALCLILTYANDALFNFPLERADCQIYLVLAVAILVSNHIRNSKNKEKPISKVALIFLSLITISAFAIESLHCQSSILQKKRIHQHNGDTTIKYTPEDWLNKMPFLPNIDESTKPIAVNVAERFATAGNHRKAIDILLQDNSNPYYSLKEYRLANYYNRLEGKSDSAAYWAQRCIEMKPLCYSPVRILVNIAGKRGESQTQLQLINSYLEKYQLEPMAWEDKVNILKRLNKLPEALETIKQARKYMPNNGKMRKLEQEFEK